MPPRWPGWPENKRFAVVLTHDVEGPKGVSRVEGLMELELKHGFRSCFNFVPGDYQLPDKLRQNLAKAGFEIGVHGLEHDGKLYHSKAGFAAKAPKITEHMQRWGSSGFRSPLMHHRLDWLHLIGAEYDASTFDTDPFEPEPDGAGTIFPFWVPGPAGDSGYVELPYTLVQDFTLFIILKQKDIGLWKKKLDWIAQRGGMALLNTHPDYMTFPGSESERDEYPIARYESFLQHLRERYDRTFWGALPGEVSRYYLSALPLAERNSRKKICMVAYSQYECDNRVRRYAEALAGRGDHVEVIAVGDENIPIGKQKLGDVTLFNVQIRRSNERWKWQYVCRLLLFLARSTVLLARLHKREQYDVIHVHNVPDFLVFAACFPKWGGAKVILDVHDIVPELFANKFGTRAGNWYVRQLKTLEKVCAGFAHHVIVSNHLWQEKLISRSVEAEKCSVFLNHVDPAIFYRRPRTREDNKFIILFPGTFQWHQGLDVAFKAMVHIRDKAPNAELHLYGRSGGAGTEAYLRSLVDRLGLNDRIKFCGSRSLEKIADVIANADLGIVPKRADSFGNEAYSTKIMEFMSQGVPVIVSKTKIDSFYFSDHQVRFFPSGDSLAMADAILEIIQNSHLRESFVSAGLEYADRNSWAHKQKEYFALIDSLSTEVFEPSEFIAKSTHTEEVEELVEFENIGHSIDRQ